MRDQSAPKKAKRTEQFGIIFDALDKAKGRRFAVGWAFGVSESFRDQLDIRRARFVDKRRSDEKKKKLKLKSLPPNLKVYRWAWTRGVPPTLTFGKGQLFFDPPKAHTLPWDKALRLLRRSVQIIDSVNDLAAAPGKSQKEGWVKFAVAHYSRGKQISRLEYTASQKDFGVLLQVGHLLHISQINIDVESKGRTRPASRAPSTQLDLL